MEKLRETQQLDKVTWGAEMKFEPRCVQLEITLQASDTAPKDRLTHTNGWTHPLTGRGHSCSGWGVRMGSCWWSRRGRRSPGCTGAPGARLAGWVQSPASRSCRQHLRAGRGPWSGPGRSPPPSTLQHAHLCAQSCSMKSPFGGKPQGWCLPGPGSRAQSWKWWRERAPDTSQPPPSLSECGKILSLSHG